MYNIGLDSFIFFVVFEAETNKQTLWRIHYHYSTSKLFFFFNFWLERKESQGDGGFGNGFESESGEKSKVKQVGWFVLFFFCFPLFGVTLSLVLCVSWILINFGLRLNVHSEGVVFVWKSNNNNNNEWKGLGQRIGQKRTDMSCIGRLTEWKSGVEGFGYSTVCGKLFSVSFSFIQTSKEYLILLLK